VIVNVQNFYPKKVFCRAVRSDHVRSEKNFLVGLKLQSELYWAFFEIVRRFQAESAAAKGDLALAQRAGETANGRQTGLVASISSGARILGEPGQQCRLPRERTMSGN
jgi:hypothetical protein